MSKVGNLRAMFEQRGETSPPSDRGRSPGIPSGSESPRPLSKVRTNFITVEKDGRIGLQRDPSRDSSVSTRRFSGETDEATPPIFNKPNAFADQMEKSTITATPKTSLKEQPIPESPRTEMGDHAASLPAQKASGGQAEAPALNPDKHTDVEEPQTQMKMGAPTDKVAVTGNGTTEEALNGAGKKAPANGSKTTAKPISKTVTKTALVATTAKTATKPAKSPTVSRAPKSPVPPAPKLAAKTPDSKNLHPEKAATPKAATSTLKPTDPSSVKKPPQLQSSPSAGFVKPKVKSPTRPVKLPHGLTTHTTASVSKVNVPRQTLSRASGAIHASESAPRPHSRTSVATTGTAGPRNLKRQSSTIGRPRPSLGPPPKQVAKDHPPTRREKEVDEGFLARMMRPTQASSSKTSDKVPVTPPRKPPAGATLPVRKPVHKFEPKPVKKATSSATASASAPASHTEEDSTAQEIAAEAEQVATAEEAIEIAKEVEGEVSLPAVAEQGSTAQEIAPVAEQVATADEAIETAKKVEGEVTLPEEADTEYHVEDVPEPTRASESMDAPEPKDAPEPTDDTLEPVEVPEDHAEHEIEAEEREGSQDISPELLTSEEPTTDIAEADPKLESHEETKTEPSAAVDLSPPAEEAVIKEAERAEEPVEAETAVEASPDA